MKNCQKILNRLCAAVLATSALALATPSQAFLNISVPTNAYITFGALDWAWAAPCAPSAPSCGGIDLTFQATKGWRLPTLADFVGGPIASDFLFQGANVPLGGVSSEGSFFSGGPTSDGACAARYFGIIHNHCDYDDGVSGAIFGNGGPFTGSEFVETWVVRNNGGAVPEPGSWALMILGFGAMGAVLRQRRSSLAAA